MVQIRRVYHRNDPILAIASPMRPPSDFSFAKCVMKAGMIWDEVERAGLPGVKGVWCHEAGAHAHVQRHRDQAVHPGHAQQAGMLAAGCQSGTYAGRCVVVVDEDVDPDQSLRRDLGDVDALRSGRGHRILPPRLERRRSIRCCASRLGRAPAPSSTPAGPGHWRNEFPEVASASPERRKAVEQKWADEIAKATGRR